MKEVEKSAKTVEEAVQLALEHLNAKREAVKIDVISEGKTGLLGLGNATAKVRVSLLDNFSDDDEESEMGNSPSITDTAYHVLEDLLKHMEVEAEIELKRGSAITHDEGEKEGLFFDIRGEDLGLLIGRYGQTLSCLQYLVRLIVASKSDNFVPLIIDVNGYRQRRIEALQSLAQRMAEQVESRKMPFSMEIMPPFERRIVHLALADHPNVTTQSIGEGEERKVVIVLKEQ